ncbi:MAG TPA: aminodeoxychorismate/anthranilate synthase component II [Lentimicrobium sp.]|jgi:anthranilate synthase/aminodeoxychorismate synthase-like glutamine amidotransferase|nr:aminodeoxychorismate/anthranilate synthase component II [Lentimicrobium sp.]
MPKNLNVFLLDNHDSFTYNLAAMLRSFGNVHLKISKPENANIASLCKFDKIVFSPGPGLPIEFPLMSDILDEYRKTKSFLGICLGHQMIAQYFGGKLCNLSEVNHGWVKSLKIIEAESLLFKDIPNNSNIGVYHSWYVDGDHLPDNLNVTAICENQLIMALQHKNLDVNSVQFHPESFLTMHGRKILANWLKR